MITSSQRSFEWLIGLEEDIEDFSTETFEETLDRELEQVVSSERWWGWFMFSRK